MRHATCSGNRTARRLPSLLAWLALGSMAPTVASGVILERKDGTRVVGYLVGEDDRTITVRRVLDGEEVTQSFAKADLLVVLRPVDPGRLEALDPAEPRGYRDYAEELAEKRDDPEARELARRLFHIAADLAPEELARGCLLGLAGLAESPAEERRCRALAYLLDPRHDRAVLAPTAAAPSRRGDRARKAFVAALQAYRTRQTTRALELARRPGVRGYFEESPGLPSYEEFVKSCMDHPECRKCGPDGRERCRTCRGTGTAGGFGGGECPSCEGWGSLPCADCHGEKSTLSVDEELLRTILRCEVSEDGPPAARPRAGGGDAGPTPWSELLRHRTRPAPRLSIRSITEHDPRLSVYRGGRWVEPGTGDGP